MLCTVIKYLLLEASMVGVRDLNDLGQSERIWNNLKGSDGHRPKPYPRARFNFERLEVVDTIQSTVATIAIKGTMETIANVVQVGM